jgi:hypothetical protein
MSPGVPIDAPIKNSAGSRSSESYSNVIDQFFVETNPRYKKNQQKKGETYCNIFVWDVTKAMGAEIPHYWVENGVEIEQRANDLYDWLENHGPDYGWTKTDATTAQNYANLGKPAVASKPNPGGIGHIAVIRPGQISSEGPTTAQAGETNFNHGTVNQGFHTLNVHYYVHD